MLSKKQMQILAFPHTDYAALICSGSVRSGKTSIMTVAFIDWAMDNFNGQLFGLCGKTVDSATKNIIAPYTAMTRTNNRYSIKWRRMDKILEVRRGAVKNTFEVFGGKDESSYMLIQGRTLAGVMLDEVALMPESFVNQALARCSVNGARLWFSCNPGNPQHWFYTDWIQRHNERNALYLHFTLDDNPGLSEETKQRYHDMFTGVFRERYVLGKWVAAEGVIYRDSFSVENNVTEDIPLDRPGEWYISIDYGTLNPFAAGLWFVTVDKAYMVNEYYYSGRTENAQKTDEEYYTEIERLAGNRRIKSVIVDPSAANFIATLRAHKRFGNVRKANNAVLDGIRCTAEMFRSQRIMIHPRCKAFLREIGLYSWDSKKKEDAVIKEWDHCLSGDTLVDTVDGQVRIEDLVGKTGYVYCTDGEKTRTGYFHDVRMTRSEAEIFEITLTDGTTIKATADHPILTKRGWIFVGDLRPDDEIVKLGG